jgi:hypothetical protein
VVATPELEELVRQELRPAVAELVARIVPELVAEALNGHGPAATIAGTTARRAQDAPQASTEGESSPPRLARGESARAAVWRRTGSRSEKAAASAADAAARRSEHEHVNVAPASATRRPRRRARTETQAL